MCLSKQSTWSAYAAVAYALSVAGLPALPGLPGLPATPGLPALPGVGTVPSNLPSTGSLTKVPALPTSLPTDPSVVLKNNIVEAIQILQYIATELLSISLPGVGSVGIGSSLIPYLLSRVAGLLIVPGI